MRTLRQRLLTTTFLSCAPLAGCVIVGPEDGAKSPDDATATEDDAQAASASRIRQSVAVADATGGEPPRRVTPSRPIPPEGFIGGVVKLDPPKEAPPSSSLEVTSVVPSAAAGGSLVAIFGAGFGDDKDATSVSFSRAEGTILAMHDSEILVTLPEGANPGPLVVQQGEGRSRKEATYSGLQVLAVDGGFGRAVPGGEGLDVALWSSEGVADGELPPDLAGTPAALNLRIPDLTLASGPFGTNLPDASGPAVAASMTTILFTPSNADYEVCMRSSGAARLLVEGYELVSLPAGQGSQCNTITLDQGGFALQVDYVTGADGAVDLSVEWAMDGGEAAPIPSSALSWLSK
ncbi:MAG: IPT/TIG domain-containing protein [Nannocystaceae bacterium]